jgi:hypothetical protein
VPQLSDNRRMNYDVIGDVHGHYDKLVGLLDELGYACRSGAWRHPKRTAVFVGDLIDRGPRQMDTLDLVRRMVDCGAARCIMGNHEFNAIAWATPDPDAPGEYLRPHGKSGNRNQHRAFLEEVEGTQRHDDAISWFKTLPLWLDLGGVRIVHACWHQASIDLLVPLMTPGHTFTDALLVRANRHDDPVFEAVENLCKGLEIRLPDGATFLDKDGKARSAVRLRWWQHDLTTFREAAIGPREDMAVIPDVPLPHGIAPPPYDGPPVLFGHYWFTGVPTVISPRFACLDYSAAKAGPLVAYRWDGETALTSAKLRRSDEATAAAGSVA